MRHGTHHLPTTPREQLRPAGAPIHLDAHDQPDSLTALEHLMRTSNATAAALAQLVDHLTGINEPPEYRRIVFNVGDQIRHSQDSHVSPSIGYYNPTAVTIYLDVTGAGASSQARAIPLPPNSTGTFPIKVQRIAFGLDAPAAAELVLHTWRYRTLQALS